MREASESTETYALFTWVKRPQNSVKTAPETFR
jgi:hypothetical protein